MTFSTSRYSRWVLGVGFGVAIWLAAFVSWFVLDILEDFASGAQWLPLWFQRLDVFDGLMSVSRFFWLPDVTGDPLKDAILGFVLCLVVGCALGYVLPKWFGWRFNLWLLFFVMAAALVALGGLAIGLLL